jgi:hypothetical protein
MGSSVVNAARIIPSISSDSCASGSLGCYRSLFMGTLILFGFIVLVGQLAQAQNSASLIRRFEIEAPAKWREYRSFAERLQGTVIWTDTIRDAKGTFRSQLRGQYEIKQNERCAAFLRQFLGRTGPEAKKSMTEGEVSVVNPVYAFKLSRRTPDNGWLLEQLDLHGNGKAFAGKPVRDLLMDFIPVTLVYNTLLSSFMQDKYFKILRASAMQQGDQNFIRIEFEYTGPQDFKRSFEPVRSGSIILMPDSYWLVKEWQVKTRYSNGIGEAKAEIMYKSTASGFPILVRRIECLKSHSSGRTSDSVLEYDLHESSSLPGDEKFRLSAYGLPEPQGVIWKKSSSWYLWFIGAAIVFLAASGYLRYRVQRRQKAPAQDLGNNPS